MSTLGPLTAGFDVPWERLADQSAATEGIDSWGTSLLWGRAIAAAFLPSTVPLGALLGASALTVLRHVPTGEQRPALLPLDAVWGFGASVVGRVGAEEIDALTAMLRAQNPLLTVLGGLREGSATWTALVEGLGGSFQLGLGEERVRCRASLEGGIDGYLARRSRSFRRNLRQMQRRLTATALTVEVLDQSAPTSVLARLHAIERASWKGADGSGIESPEMSALYGRLVGDLHAQSRLRVAVAVDGDGNDVAYVLGGVLGGLYRGLQISYRESERSLGLGNMLQWHEIQRLCTDTSMHTYDLGMDIEYKRAWAEEQLATRTLLVGAP